MRAIDCLETTARTIGDALHVLSFLVIIVKMRRTKSCSGISLKSQVLALCVFVGRYIDMAFVFAGVAELSKKVVYNTIMKIVFISLQAYIVYAIKFIYNYSYDADFDDMKVSFLLLPSLIGGMFLKIHTPTKVSVLAAAFYYLVELLWTTSIILESVSILPQLMLLQKTGEAETLTIHYIIFLGLYRFFYIVGWAFKWLGGSKVIQLLVCASIIQTLLYSNFFVVYIRYFLAKGRSIKISPKEFFGEAFGKKK